MDNNILSEKERLEILTVNVFSFLVSAIEYSSIDFIKGEKERKELKKRVYETITRILKEEESILFNEIKNGMLDEVSEDIMEKYCYENNQEKFDSNNINGDFKVKKGL